MIETLIGFIGVVVASASVYFQARDPSRRNSRACKSLARLLVALREIGETGRQIGAALDSKAMIMGDDRTRKAAYDNLIQMLEVQNENLREAQRAFPEIEDVLKIHPPALSELYFHLRGKNHRIDILYDAAQIERLKQDPREGVEHWEVSKLESEGESMRDLLAEAVSSNRIDNITVGENLREADENFELILEAIGPLKTLIDQQCTPGDLA